MEGPGACTLSNQYFKSQCGHGYGRVQLLCMHGCLRMYACTAGVGPRTWHVLSTHSATELKIGPHFQFVSALRL